jgi:hypothetical protein
MGLFFTQQSDYGFARKPYVQSYGILR